MKKLATHYKMTLVHPGTLSQITGLKEDNVISQNKRHDRFPRPKISLHDNFTNF